MTNEELDNLSKAAFPSTGNTAYDAKYWNNMEAMLGPTPKRKGFIFWWGTGAALFIIGSLVALSSNWYSSSSQIGIAENYQPRTGTEMAGLTPFEIESNITNESKVALNKVEDFQISLNNKTEKNANNTVSEIPSEENLSESNKVIPSTLRSKTSENINQPQVENAAIVSSDDRGEEAKNEVVEAKAFSQTPVSIALPLSATVITESDKFDKNELSIEESPVLDDQLVAENESSQFPKEGFNMEESALKTTSNGNIELMTFKEFNSFQLMKDVELMDCCDNFSPLEKTTEFGEPIETKKSTSFFTELEGGMARFGKNEVTVSNSQLELLTVDPSPIREWNIGVNVGIERGNWYMFSGVNYQEYSQNFNAQLLSMDSNLTESYKYRQEMQYSDVFVRNIVSKVPNGSGFSYQLTGTEYRTDSALVNITDTILAWDKIEVKASEKYEYKTQYLQIPLAIGYTYSIKSKWLLEGFIRTDIGFLLNQKGTYFNETDEVFYPLKESSQASKTTMSYQLGIGLGYKLTDEITVRIRPSFRQVLKGPFDGDNYNRSGVGVNAALRIKL